MLNIKKLYLVSTALVGLAGALPSLGFAADKAADASDVQEIVVTGSRIARPNLEQPTPVSMLSNLQIVNSGSANLGDIVAKLPNVGTAATVRANSNNYGNGAGISAIDLRNLGTSRTLVLVDGQRHVAGDLGSNAVDTNSIPSALVERVEIITGGASAVYGSDAVSGVVNIVMKKSFEGIDASVQTGGFDQGFGRKNSASITAGRNFLDGKLNFTGSAFWTDEQGIMARQIPNSRNYGTITNPADLDGSIDPTYLSSPSAIPNNGIPDTLLVQNVGSEYVARNGVLLSPYTFNPLVSFDAHGNPIPVPVRTGYNSFAFGQLPANCQDCYFPETYTQISSPIRTHGLEFRTNYTVNDHLHLGLDAKFVESQVNNLIQPSFSFGDYQIAPDNAFVTPAITAAIGVGNEFPYYAAFINDVRDSAIARRTYRIAGNIGGDFDTKYADIRWDGALNYGQTASHIASGGIRINENFAAAFDSVIDPVTHQAACRINVPSAQGVDYVAPSPAHPNACVPFNPFGSLTNSAAVYGYSFGRYLTRDFLTQEVASLNFATDTSKVFNLQGGPIGLAIGGEYRMERTYELNDAALTDGSTENLASDSAGGFNVWEAYAEANLPIFHKAGFMLDELSLDGAYRYGHYSTVGDVYANKISGIYGPFSWLKFRGTAGLAVRAPNITEAFSPQQQSYFNVTDPCDQANINSNVNYAKNCASAGIPTDFVSNLNASIIGQISGNQDLSPEKSLSYTAGFVIQPTVIPRLTVTVDYYSILIKNAITLVAAQDIIDNCFSNGAGLDDQYCALFTRGSDQNIDFVKTTYVNAAKVFTQGWEFQVAYNTPAHDLFGSTPLLNKLNGQLGMTLDANYVFKLRDYPFQNNLKQYHIREGAITGAEGDVPSVRGLADFNYKDGPWNLDYQMRYLGRADRYSRDKTEADGSESVTFPVAGAKVFHSVAIHYDASKWMAGSEIFGGVNNIFGELPPTGLVQGSAADAGYELGRYVFLGLRLRR